MTIWWFTRSLKICPDFISCQNSLQSASHCFFIIATILLYPRYIFRKPSLRRYVYMYYLFMLFYPGDFYTMIILCAISHWHCVYLRSDHASSWRSTLVNVKHVLTKLFYLLRYFGGEIDNQWFPVERGKIRGQ